MNRIVVDLRRTKAKSSKSLTVEDQCLDENGFMYQTIATIEIQFS